MSFAFVCRKKEIVTNTMYNFSSQARRKQTPVGGCDMHEYCRPDTDTIHSTWAKTK